MRRWLIIIPRFCDGRIAFQQMTEWFESEKEEGEEGDNENAPLATFPKSYTAAFHLLLGRRAPHARTLRLRDTLLAVPQVVWEEKNRRN